MNSFQINTQKLEQLRQEAAIDGALKPIRQEHLKNLQHAIKTLLLEIQALTVGSLEFSTKAQVQKHV